MAVRPIDGNELLKWCEKIIDQACHPVTVQIGEVFRDKVRSMPTLAPPNELLTPTQMALLGIAREPRKFEGGDKGVRYTNFTMFDRQYPKDKQAEGLAISQAIAIGKCNECRFLKQCESDRNFTFPADAYCQKRKQEILKEWG